MHFSTFTIVVTHDCNFQCTYCYQKKKEEYLLTPRIEKALDFFYPRLNNECFIQFYGGEPLLAFAQIEDAVGIIQNKNKTQKKKVRFTLTTNGSLIDDKILEFLSKHKFFVLLSFDGMAQNANKKAGSFEQISTNIKALLNTPDIELETNSVFTQESLARMSETVPFLIECGVPSMNIVFSRIVPWQESSLSELESELSSLRRFLQSYYKKTGKCPAVDFQKTDTQGLYECSAAKTQMTLAADETLWGCYLFSDYFRANPEAEGYDRYCFGDLDSFINDYKTIYPKVLFNYSNLRVDQYFTSYRACKECDDIQSCEVCPVDNLFSETGDIRKISDRSCEMKKILMRQKRLFRQQ